MTDWERRIQSCVDHINTAVDVDPWAKELVAEMGKEILKAQLSKEDTTSDCISRQEAIRIASGYCHPANIAKELAKLPSVQPDIIACGDCKHYIPHDKRCGYWNHGVKPLEWCCHAERRTDGSD